MSDPSGATTAQSSAGAAARSGGRGAHRLIDTVRDAATARLSAQKNRATDRVGSMAEAVRQSTRQLRDQEHEWVAHYFELAADQLDRFTTRMRDKDVDDIIRDVQDAARRRPALFVGGAFALGLIGARVLKSAARASVNGAREETDSTSGWRAIDRADHMDTSADRFAPSENPLVVGAGAFVIGAALGLALRETEREDALIDSARSLVDRARQMASNAASPSSSSRSGE